MAPSFFGGSGSASQAKYFDIRLVEPYIIFRGNNQEAASAHVKGTLVLCLSEPLTIKHLKLHLTGVSKVSWPFLVHPVSSISTRKLGKERNIFEKSWKFRDAGKGKTEIMPADNYEFPFDVVLPGNTPESIEGLTDTWITYQFRAVIGRKYAKDIQIRKPLRLIRTLGPSALELSHIMSVENIWPNKLEYSISIPSKAVIFGTSIQVDFRLVPILKGLKIGDVSTQVIETYDLRNGAFDDGVIIARKSCRTIVSDLFYLESEQRLELLNEEVEGYQFTRVIELPKTLRKCIQDTDAMGMKIRHKLKFRIQLCNPDGHVSELRATLPIVIFLSPDLPLDDNNNVIDQSPESIFRAQQLLSQPAPPLYGEHHFDMLYSELSPYGYHTPGPYSVPGSPYGLSSRNLSAENLSSLHNLSRDNVSPSALHSRLSNLNIPNSESSRDLHAEQQPSLTRRRSQTSPAVINGFNSLMTPDFSRRGSEEDNLSSGVATPRARFREVEDMSRVPSYSAALQSRTNVYSADLPNYEVATAGEASSQHRDFRGPQPSNLPSRSFTLHDGDGSEPERRLRILQARARC
ncbi:hypothetical protein FQN57_002146 [Myotisia sp. PD_48]|nr:hypothetical protein FQN57_002146 [Myotisia sp. PD_48]